MNALDIAIQQADFLMSRNFCDKSQDECFALLAEWELILKKKQEYECVGLTKSDQIGQNVGVKIEREVLETKTNQCSSDLVQNEFIRSQGGMPQDTSTVNIVHEVMIGGGKDKVNYQPQGNVRQIIDGWVKDCDKVIYSDGYDPSMGDHQRSIGTGKAVLNQYCQANRIGLPTYKCAAYGRTIEARYVSVVILGGLAYVGPEMATKKKSEEEAAIFTLFSMGIKNVMQFKKPPQLDPECTQLNYKGMLQEYCHKEHILLPVYETLHEGMPHCPLFRTRTMVNKITYISDSCTSVKLATHNCAKKALEGQNKIDYAGAYRCRLWNYCKKTWGQDPIFDVDEERGETNSKLWKMNVRLPNGISTVNDNFFPTKGLAKEELAMKVCNTILSLTQNISCEVEDKVKGVKDLVELKASICTYDGPIARSILQGKVGSYILRWKKGEHYHIHKEVNNSSLIGLDTGKCARECDCDLSINLTVEGWVTNMNFRVFRAKSLIGMFRSLLIVIDKCWMSMNPIKPVLTEGATSSDFFFPEDGDGEEINFDIDPGDEILFNPNLLLPLISGVKEEVVNADYVFKFEVGQDFSIGKILEENAIACGVVAKEVD